jgi:hypothetical protein
VLVQVSVVQSSSVRRALGVHAQGQATSAGLAVIAFASHIAYALIEIGSSGVKGVGAEALSAIFCACHAESLGIAVGDALCVGDFVVTDVGKLEASHDSVAIAELVGIASIV